MKSINPNRWVGIGIGYTIIFLIVVAYLNYTVPYDANPVTAPSFPQLFFWATCYIPLFVFPVLGKWEITEFGLSINPISLVVSLSLAFFCGISNFWKPISILSAATEAFARTGEELFFRGFLFLLLMKIFEKKRRSWLWACLVSSLLFAMIHTQKIQTAFSTTQGSNWIAFTIAESLLNVFLIGFCLALLRYWAKSILPDAIIHSVLNAGPLTIPFVILYYSGLLVWAGTRKTKVFSGFIEEASNAK